MFRTIGLFAVFLMLIGFNLGLMIQNTAVLVHRRVSKDGWSETCQYYKPVWIVTISRPIQTPCDKTLHM